MIVCLVIVVLLGGVLRTATAGGSLWLDELHTAWTVQGEWQELPPRAAIGNQSPAFFAVVKASTELGGMNEWTLRLPSLLAGVGLIVAAWQAVRKWTGDEAAAVVAAFAVALDPWCVLFSAEARAYALVQLLGLIHLLLFSELLTEATWPRRIVWVVGGGLLFYLHYTAALLIAAELVAYVVLVATRRAPGYVWWLALMDFSATGLLWLLAREHVAEIAANREAWNLFVPPASLAGFFELFPLYAGVVGFAILLAAGQALRPAHAEQPAEPDAPAHDFPTAWILVGCWLFVPLVIALVATLSDEARLLFLRYMSPALVAIPLAAGLAIAAQREVWGKWLAGVLVVAALFALPARWPIESTPIVSLMDGHGWIGQGGQDWRGALQFIHERKKQDGEQFPPDRWAIAVRSGYIEADRLAAEPQNELLKSYCLSPVNSLYHVETAGRTFIPLATSNLGPLDEFALRALQYRGKAWLLLNGNEEVADEYLRLLDKGLRPHGSRVLGAVKHIFPGVVVCEVSISKGP